MSLSYYVETADVTSGPWTEVDGPLSSSPSSFVATPETSFFVRVKRIANGQTEYSDPVRVTTLDTPVLVAVGGLNANHVELSWGATCATTYRVYRRIDDSESFELLGEVNTEAFDDYEVSNGVTYWYYVVGVTAGGFESLPSNLESASVTRGAITMSRATAYQGVQLGVESAAGTGVAADKRLLNMGLTVDPVIPIREVRYPGSKVPTDFQRGQEHSEGKISGVADFNHLIYFFSSMFGVVATSTTLTLDFKRTWTPSTRVPITPKTYTIEQGSSAGAEKWTYSFIPSLSLKGNQTEVTIDADLFGQKTNRGITMTASPADIPPMAVDPYAAGLYYSTDNSAYTKLTDVLDYEFNFGGLHKPVFHVNDSNPSYDDTVELMPDWGVNLAFEEGTEVDTMMTALYAQTKLWLRFKALGVLIETGSPNQYHMLQMTVPVAATKPNPGDKSDVWGNTMNFTAYENASTGMANIQVVNLLDLTAAGV